MSAALGLALSAAIPSKADDAADIKAIQKSLEEIKKDLGTLQKFAADAKPDLYGGDKAGDKGLRQRMIDLEDSVRDLDKKLTTTNSQLSQLLRNSSASALSKANNPVPDPGPMPGVPQQMPSTPSTSALFGPTPATNRGTVRIVNEYAVEVTLILNKQAYRFQPRETRALPVPAGEYTYELLNSGSQATKSTLKDGETVTLRIH
jgi:hypothetical protein